MSQQKDLKYVKTFEQFSYGGNYEEVNEGLFENKYVKELKEKEVDNLEDISKSFQEVFNVKPEPKNYQNQFRKKYTARQLANNEFDDEKMKEALKQAKDKLEKGEKVTNKVVPIIQKNGKVKLVEIEKKGSESKIHAQRGGN